MATDRTLIPGRALLAGALLFLVASLLDRWAFQYLVHPEVYASDAGRLARIAGFAPTWIVGAVALVLHDRLEEPRAHGGPWRRGLLLAAAPVLAGFLSEILKLLIRRERPKPHGGAYYFRPFDDAPWSTTALGLPSGHAITAFAGASMMAYLFPRTAPVWLLWAAAGAATRVMAQAHFLSDVVAAAILGAFVSRALVVLVARGDARRAAA